MENLKKIVLLVPERQGNVAIMKLTLPDLIEVCEPMEHPRQAFKIALAEAGNDRFLFCEDDIWFSESFAALAWPFIQANPNRVIQFFNYLPDFDAGIREKEGSTFEGTCCVYMPEGFASGLLTYMEQEWEPTRGKEFLCSTDRAIGDFLLSRNETYIAYEPSLAQHNYGVSMIDPRRSKNRHSFNFVK